MLSLVDKLKEHSTWEEFLQFKKTHGMISESKLNQLEKFIENKTYLKVTSKFSENSFNFDYPRKAEIAKSGSSKKRVVYIFNTDDSFVLKCLSWLFYKYDDKIADSCYAFRHARSAKDAIRQLKNLRFKKFYTLKMDIHDYFNSMPVDALVERLKQAITDDNKLLNCMIDLLVANKAYYKGKLISEQRGAMAGMPLAGFLANIYLKEMDQQIEQIPGIYYFRYSDDITILTPDEKQRDELFLFIKDAFIKNGLEINADKTELTAPGEWFNFLGFKFSPEGVLITDHTLKKLMDKIHRRGKRMYRWRLENNAPFDGTAAAMFRHYNKKFYSIEGDDAEFTWCYWYFPEITSAKQLKRIDQHLLGWARYLYKGTHNKACFRITIDHLKQLGYNSLYDQYIKFKQDRFQQTTFSNLLDTYAD